MTMQYKTQDEDEKEGWMAMIACSEAKEFLNEMIEGN